MSPYKNFLNAAKEYLNSVPFFKFLLSSHMFVFGLGGLLYLLGVFPFGLANFMSPIGILLMYAGLLLTVIKEDVMTLLITSGIIALGSLIAWIIGLVSYYGFYSLFSFGPFFYFLIFGAITVLVLLKSEKFKQMRAESAARVAQMGGIPCPTCGAMIPMNAGFCPACGASKPATYAAPMPPQPPVQPQTQPVPPQPPVQPQAQPVPPQPAPPVQPSADAATMSCSACGETLPADSKFCGKCGAKQ